jgi:integrase
MSLVDARERARECRRLLLDGHDPIEHREASRMQQRAVSARGTSFKECTEAYIAAHQAGWRNAKHRAQWSSTLAAYAFPLIGDLAISTIDTALVLKCVEPIWNEKPETAKRVRGRIESVLDWAAARNFRQGDNPARWRGHLDKLLPSPSRVRAVKHHSAIGWQDIPQFMVELRARQELSAHALEFTVLTACRTGEVIGALWSEFDFAGKVWAVPEGRMKAKREHRVPLSKRVLEILELLPRQGEHVFSGGRLDRPLSNMAMLKTLERMKRGGLTVHGFRSTFRDWAAETTAYPNHVVEMALAHTIGDKVEAAYRRGDLFEKRRRMMEDWARYCARSPSERGTVVALNSGDVASTKGRR